ncbi:MAG: DUF2126 domain-containing protein [Vicinamibacterales bacterium]
MSIHVALTHSTHYRYDRAVTLSPQLVRLRPAPHCRTPILSYSQRVTPSDHFLNWQQDPQANYVARLMFPSPVREFRVEVDLVAELSVYNPFDFFLEPEAECAPFDYEPWQQQELQAFLRCDPLTPAFARYLEAIARDRRRTIDFLVELNRQLHEDVRYLIRLEPGVQTPEETLTRGSGSCRDSGWLLVQLLRHLGFAARFVSGYLIQLKPDLKAIDGPSGTDEDFTDLHAWCEVYLPGAGWIGLDPTSGLLAGEGHLPLACTPEPSSAAPIAGSVDECEVSFEHQMAVRRVAESPRVTKPYTDTQWQAILDLGHAVDRDLDHADVRLTMGGEPTFVSVDDVDGAEWTVDALGPTKRLRAADLLARLRAHFGAQGFVHCGQGKWYPGEQLPRWALGCYWRVDGEPCWHDTALIADESQPGDASHDDARRFLEGVAAALGVAAEHVQAGFEDTFYYLWRERRLPVNVDPFDARLDDEQERARLRRVFTQQLHRPVGYVLPIERDRRSATAQWRTGPWSFRDDCMYLVPGDSPMGFRLPLDSLPWAADGDRTAIVERDPLALVGPLSRQASRAAPSWQRPPTPSAAGFVHMEPPLGTGRGTVFRGAAHVPRFSSAAGIVRTAMCAEPRGGILYVFMPPVATADDYLELVSAVEATAAAQGVRVLLEGYPPPYDPRLRHITITPDPGVVEVNIHPASSWDELVRHTTVLYEEARLARLTTEKFMLDGRHTGTGGGNHFVLGGVTPADSPFLRRPDLLRSLVSYWHNHPSLSYLFSGLFIGPTSQAPRIDEARHDSVYELEIAFGRFPDPGRPVPPWTVDRLLRHLLVDVTGNTHRAEFCIDKLFAPESAAGRRGLVEMRAFEMPPHARLSLSQQLLLRALIARFWRQPYTAPLTRWGTELHDRFMLPYFIWLDFMDVVGELRGAGYPFDPAWFDAHFEFRFPLMGELATRAVRLTLRQALEPWHVLGEEAAAGGTTRFVDSSVERLQVLVQGVTGDRYAITCNGRPLPLHPTGTNGECVAGVRYRAWQPPSCLHPDIPVHSPLTFDLVDTWMDRAVAGCEYHVSHPGGRHYERFPVNSYEAESRRLARFTRLAHASGSVTVPPVVRRREAPYTLDLRT